MLNLNLPGVFSELNFVPHPCVYGGIQAEKKFSNGWGVSVVSSLMTNGVFYRKGSIVENTYEVAVIHPNGEIFGDVTSWMTPEQVDGVMCQVMCFPKSSPGTLF